MSTEPQHCAVLGSACVAGKKVLRGELFKQRAKPLNSTDVGEATRASDFVDGLMERRPCAALRVVGITAAGLTASRSPKSGSAQ